MTEQSTPPPAPSPSPRPQGKRTRSPEPARSSVVHDRPTVAAGKPVSRWVLVGIVALPLLAFLIFNLVDAGRSGSAEIGETFTQRSGVTVNVGAAQPYAAAAPVAGEQTYQVIVTVTNPTDEVMRSSDLTFTATVNETAVEPVALDGPLPDTIDPGVQLNVPFRFAVKDGTSGPLQVTVKDANGKTVYFTGTV